MSGTPVGTFHWETEDLRMTFVTDLLEDCLVNNEINSLAIDSAQTHRGSDIGYFNPANQSYFWCAPSCNDIPIPYTLMDEQHGVAILKMTLEDNHLGLLKQKLFPLVFLGPMIH